MVSAPLELRVRPWEDVKDPTEVSVRVSSHTKDEIYTKNGSVLLAISSASLAHISALNLRTGDVTIDSSIVSLQASSRKAPASSSTEARWERRCVLSPMLSLAIEVNPGSFE